MLYSHLCIDNPLTILTVLALQFPAQRQHHLQQHRRILFNGNGYEDSWVVEASKRGLANLKNAAEALPCFVMEKNVELMTRHGILTRQEMMARHEIHMENYSKIIRI